MNVTSSKGKKLPLNLAGNLILDDLTIPYKTSLRNYYYINKFYTYNLALWHEISTELYHRQEMFGIYANESNNLRNLVRGTVSVCTYSNLFQY